MYSKESFLKSVSSLYRRERINREDGIKQAKYCEDNDLYDYSWIPPMPQRFWDKWIEEKENAICKDKCFELTGCKNLLCQFCKLAKNKNKKEAD